MKQFYRESGILVLEWEEFERSILQGTHGFMFSSEQWKNRRLGRTNLKPQERIAMIHVLEKIRESKKQIQTQVVTTKFIKP